MDDTVADWRPTACILCECNCGIEVQVGADGRTFAKIRGDKRHPASQGYTCNKALQLDAYQNGRAGRITQPLRRRDDGSFEEVDWDIAIAEIAERFGAIRDDFGGETIFYYGGGGQGNHLGGAHSPATMAAFGARYRSSALAQEKTGEFWVNARLLGKPNRADVEHCEVAVFVGKNPYQSHGFPRARAVLKDIGKDPARSMIVIDPVRTETAELADFHLQLRPGTDIYAVTALAAVLVQEDLIAHDWLAEHAEAEGLANVVRVLARVPVDEYCAIADLDPELVRAAARRIGTAESVAVLEDLGVQMNRDSTLVSYVEKLVWLLTGNFGKRGAQYVFSSMSAIARDRGHRAGEGPRSPVVGAPIIGGLVPCNVIADEILTDHPNRYRAMLVESANPVHSLADSARMRQAMEALEFVVVIDVAMTETARLADYVLPAPTQFEKFEATFFNFDFPRNIFHLRHPVVEPPSGVLPEPEIHARLVEASGALTEADYAPLRAAAGDPEAFAAAFFAAVSDPRLRRLAAVLLYRTLGPTLPDGAAAAAVLWAAAHTCAAANPSGVKRAGFGTGLAAGENLFRAILASPSGVVITDDTEDATWDRLAGRPIQLDIPELLAEVEGLARRGAALVDPEWPFVLSAGERRAFTANTIIRDPAWRKRDAGGALRMSQLDADRLGVAGGDRVRLTTPRGTVDVAIEPTPRMRAGHISLPNGLGLTVPDESGAPTTVGIAPNELTATEDRDEWAGTPWHKHVRARVEAL
ncbi:MAG: molybdopterin-dependent oxidoreductase [Jatrophihabitans sp.]|uniref:molybdopterin-dependent oxidoreductase n=1 Tax=Jatrophihabitans sp. TaxID=1932789 RepID=UPI003913F793